MPATALRKKVRRLLEELGLPDAEVSILFVGDRAMRTLNRTYRGKDSSTDVLSFSMREGGDNGIQPHLLGDIVLAVPTAVRQAAEAGHSLSREIDLLLVHGLLHLIGYDHETNERDGNRMRRRERALLEVLGR